MSIREKFVATFGEKLALDIECAARSHENGIHDNRGSDPFKWALLICIGYKCLEVAEYRDWHGIDQKPAFRTIKRWVRKHADLGSHDGDCDYLALITGKYSDFIRSKEA